MNKVIVIVGPTGVGKTNLSLEIAKHFNGEIINADSTQIYKDLNIATAKIIDQKNIPHHLIDIKNISEDYTVYNYQKDARKKIEQIFERKKTPILVGGTGLYIKAVLYNYKFKKETNFLKFKDIETSTLFSKLIKVDPNTKIHPNNRQRIIRALNYYNNFKLPLSEKEKSNKLLYKTIFIGLKTEKEILYQKINERVSKMVEEGLIEEAKKIYDLKIYSKAVMTPIGYKELFPYFENKQDLESCLELIKKRSRNYAKRQMTWFNNQMDIKWFQINYNNFNKTVQEVIKYIKK